MSSPRIAVLSFPGNNCEVETLRALKRAGMQPVFCRWNGDRKALENADGYVIPGGFSYEDRGRAGMIPARDPVMEVIREQASAGKPVIGICNGAQVLVESGLIPNAEGLQMSLARNEIDGKQPGFLSSWVWITPACSRDRCATSDWKGAMHMPIAHGEGRFTTKDADLLKELQQQNQIAFQYCDANGTVSSEPEVTPNGSALAIAGICNPNGNVVALMPHPERSAFGAPYFESLYRWIEKNPKTPYERPLVKSEAKPVQEYEKSHAIEVFIDTKIVNNEERSVEQAAKRISPSISVKQLRYIPLDSSDPTEVLGHISLFNSNKESAYLRRGSELTRWNPGTKTEENVDHSPFADAAVTFVRFDTLLPQGSHGVCYVCSGISDSEAKNSALQEVFANPHASTLVRLP